MAKDYTYKISNIVVTARGEQATGKNAGRAYAMGSFETTVKGRDGEDKVVKKFFKAFDQTFESGKGITPATAILGLVDAGITDAYVTGQFQPGRARDASDASKGTFQDFRLAFVETVEAHQAFVADQRAKKAA